MNKKVLTFNEFLVNEGFFSDIYNKTKKTSGDPLVGVLAVGGTLLTGALSLGMMAKGVFDMILSYFGNIISSNQSLITTVLDEGKVRDSFVRELLSDPKTFKYVAKAANNLGDLDPLKKAIQSGAEEFGHYAQNLLSSEMTQKVYSLLPRILPSGSSSSTYKVIDKAGHETINTIWTWTVNGAYESFVAKIGDTFGIDAISNIRQLADGGKSIDQIVATIVSIVVAIVSAIIMTLIIKKIIKHKKEIIAAIKDPRIVLKSFVNSKFYIGLEKVLSKHTPKDFKELANWAKNYNEENAKSRFVRYESTDYNYNPFLDINESFVESFIEKIKGWVEGLIEKIKNYSKTLKNAYSVIEEYLKLDDTILDKITDQSGLTNLFSKAVTKVLNNKEVVTAIVAAKQL